jgi:ATPase subunit of ABC transporter with duplicated ATPase domains
MRSPLCRATPGIDRGAARVVPNPKSSKPPLLWATGISKSHDGQRVQFSGLDFALAEGARWAVVGPNGCGKSTLLAVLAAAEPPSSGDVQLKRGTRLAYLKQEPCLRRDLPVLEAVLASEASLALRLAARFSAAQAAGDAALLTSLGEQMDAAGAWDVEAEVRTVLTKLGCTSFLERAVGQLSGGQAKRVALATVLLQQPDVLLLDEPTNHLSLQGVEWLEERLTRGGTTLLMVTHDRVTMDRVCTHTLELDGGGGCFRHDGGYTAFVAGREARFAAAQAAAGNAAKLLKREEVWMSRQPQGRQAKQQARQDAFYELQAAAKAPERMGVLELDKAASVRSGGTLIELHGVSLRAGGAHGPVILRDFSYTFQPRERLGVVGPNGAGKSTFMKLCAGALAADSGRVVIGETVRFGFYEQQFDWPQPAQRVVDYVTELAAEAREREREREAQQTRAASGAVQASSFGGWNVRTLLERFQFSNGRQATPIAELSGGERRRLQLMTVLAAQPNVLFLDEPTNDLDVSSIEALEELLAAFDGIVVVCGHDRSFMAMCQHLLVFEGDGRISDWRGTLAELRERQKANAAAASAPAAAAAAPPAAAGADKEARRLATNASKKIPRVEADLERLEAELSAFDEQLMEAGADAGRAAALAAKRGEAACQLEALYAEYERLDALVRAVAAGS